MKSLMHIYIIIICTFLFFGCTKEEEVESDQGLIFGEWEGHSRTLVYNNGTTELLPTNTCEGYILGFYEDGLLIWNDFLPDAIDSCGENLDTELIGIWERISNGKYIFTLVSSLDDSEIYITPALITFNNNGAETMDIRYAGLPKDAPKEAAYYYLTLFKR